MPENNEPEVVFAKTSMVVSDPPGPPVRLRRGDAYDVKHPLVVRRPELFETESSNVVGRVQRVEQGTRSPGERRR